MPKIRFALTLAMTLSVVGIVTAGTDSDFQLALPNHQGQLRWSATGFKIIESSVKPNGREIGIRAKNESGLTFLGFLFLFPEQAPMTRAKCRDGVLEPAKKENPQLNVVLSSEQSISGGPPVSLVTYVAPGPGGKPIYSARGFIAAEDICGDLEFYSDAPINTGDKKLTKIFKTYRLDKDYVPRFGDAFTYAEVLYKQQKYKAAAPIFEIAIAKLETGPNEGIDTKTLRRVTTDRLRISYGISGDVAKARATFQKAILGDPDYPLYYYNLACADAEEKKLADARVHLQQAFARKANVSPGEKMPDPTTDSSFLHYQSDREFWMFLKSLAAEK